MHVNKNNVSESRLSALGGLNTQLLGLIPRFLWYWYLFGKEYIASNLSMFHFDQTGSQAVVPHS